MIVRLLLAYEALPDLSMLPDAQQKALARDLSELRWVDKATLAAIVNEFTDEMEGIALSFPADLDSTLAQLEDFLSPHAASQLRQEAGLAQVGDPWTRLSSLSAEQLCETLRNEPPEISAVILSKLPVTLSAQLLGQIPGPEARRIAFAISRTSGIAPQTVRAIGSALAEALDARPPAAFDDGPVARVGAILNNTTAATRDDVLTGLDEADRAFADEVRRAIFTFAHIPTRIAPRDVSRILSELDPNDTTMALQAASVQLPEVVDFILGNISRRMADQLRDTISEAPPLPASEQEAAMTRVINRIRAMEAEGALVLIAEADIDVPSA